MLGLIDSDDLYVAPHPVRWQIDTATVPTGFDDLFDHLFTIYFKFYFGGRMDWWCLDHLVLFFVCHVKYPSLSNEWIGVVSKVCGRFFLTSASGRVKLV